ncbi:phosphotransferase [Streptomyces sp. NPDC006314]|uniref:phosphotransferase n=1 Tax=Streptomyces sp. NPDC006314 TaxID=3154475 RepID=UPI0033AF90B0
MRSRSGKESASVSSADIVGIDAGAVNRWFRTLGVDFAGPLTYDRIGLGQSDLTYLVRDREGRRWVLRRPPLGHRLESAHDVAREARILTALEGTAVPTPRVLGLTVRELPALEDLARRLAVAVPEQRELALVHGDFHLRNVITSYDSGEVTAVLELGGVHAGGSVGGHGQPAGVLAGTRRGGNRRRFCRLRPRRLPGPCRACSGVPGRNGPRPGGTDVLARAGAVEGGRDRRGCDEASDRRTEEQERHRHAHRGTHRCARGQGMPRRRRSGDPKRGLRRFRRRRAWAHEASVRTAASASTAWGLQKKGRSNGTSDWWSPPAACHT